MRRILTFLKLFRYDLLVMLVAIKHRDTPRNVKGLLLAAILYLLSPIDLLPDAIPLAGVIDDVVIVPAAVMGLTKCCPVMCGIMPRNRPGECSAICPLSW